MNWNTVCIRSAERKRGCFSINSVVGTDMEMAGKIKVADLNTLLSCILCNGYFIDATTISECLHSFCRTCIVRYLQSNKFCPICEVQVHKAKPLLSIRADQTLQDIVYKVVPGLFRNEMKKRRDFYALDNLSDGVTVPISSEKRGDVVGCERLIFTSEDIISVSMEYCSLNLILSLPPPTENGECLENDVPQSVPKAKVHRRYFQCPGAVTIRHLKKLLRKKYGLATNQEIDILYMHDQLREEYTLTDLAYIYSWRRNGPLRLFYKFHDASCRAGEYQYDGPCIIPAVPEPLTVVANCPELSSSMPRSSAAVTPSSQLQRHPSPPASPQMATEPDNFKLANPKSAAMQNGCLNGVNEAMDSSNVTMQHHKLERRKKVKMNVGLFSKDKFEASATRLSTRRRTPNLPCNYRVRFFSPYNGEDEEEVNMKKKLKNGLKKRVTFQDEILDKSEFSYYKEESNSFDAHTTVSTKTIGKADVASLSGKNSL